MISFAHITQGEALTKTTLFAHVPAPHKAFISE